MANFKYNKNKGFTVVEMLVIITIIGIISSVVLVSISSFRANARDVVRYSDLENVQLALHLYHDKNGSYPSTGGDWWTVCTNGLDPTARDTSGANGYIPNLAPAYTAVLPTDPLGCVQGSDGGVFHGYIYRSDGVDYKFSTDWSAEVGSECELGKKFADRRTEEARHTFCSVYTDGAYDW